MSVDVLFKIAHAAVANLDGISIEYLVYKIWLIEQRGSAASARAARGSRLPFFTRTTLRALLTRIEIENVTVPKKYSSNFNLNSCPKHYQGSHRYAEKRLKRNIFFFNNWGTVRLFYITFYSLVSCNEQNYSNQCRNLSNYIGYKYNEISAVQNFSEHYCP
jgi:hypothetical protein